MNHRARIPALLLALALLLGCAGCGGGREPVTVTVTIWHVYGGETYLNPQGSATREQVATILMEFCKNVKK